MEDIKKWLRRGWNIDRRIEELIEEKDKAFARVTGTVASNDGNESQRIAGGNSSEAKMLKYSEYSIILDQMIDELVYTKAEIMDVIKQIEDIRLQQLLVLRYIRFYEWEKIAEKMMYNYRHVLRLHGMALIEAKKIRERSAL